MKIKNLLVVIVSLFLWVNFCPFAFSDDDISDIYKPLAGLWYNQAKPGHGIDFEFDDSNLAAVWYTYEQDGTPVWYLAVAPYSGNATWSATLNKYKWEESNPTATQVGSISVKFLGPSSAEFHWTLNGQSGNESIVKFYMAEVDTDHDVDHDTDHDIDHDTDHHSSHDMNHDTDHDTDHDIDHDTDHDNDHDVDHDTDHDTDHDVDHDTDHQSSHHHRSLTGLWYNSQETGYGYSIERDDDMIAVVSYFYDANGEPRWALSFGNSQSVFSDDDMEALMFFGPCPSCQGSSFRAVQAGTIRKSFNDWSHGVISVDIELDDPIPCSWNKPADQVILLTDPVDD